MSTKEKLIEEQVELCDVICCAMRDWDDYMDECHETETPPIYSFEDFIVDGVISAGYRKQEWISVKDRLPTEDEDSNHRVVGVVNGYNGKIRFTDAEIFVRYCHKENAWWSDDYDIEGCTVERFYVVPQPPEIKEVKKWILHY